MWPRVGELRTLELGTPGELRTWLNGLVLSGAKRATAGLYQSDYLDEGEELEHPGERLALLDSAGAVIGEVEVTSAELVPLSAVTWEFADAEGEGFRSVAHWREVHERFWAGIEVTDESIVTCVSFRLTGR